MPFCPECKYEFVAGVKQCADCLVELVDELPEEFHPEVKWAPLHALPGPVYAEMVKGALEKNGIPCLIQTDALASAYGVQGTAMGGAETLLFVPEDQLKKSTRILFQILEHI
jgi:hypothetical protein